MKEYDPRALEALEQAKATVCKENFFRDMKTIGVIGAFWLIAAPIVRFAPVIYKWSWTETLRARDENR